MTGSSMIFDGIFGSKEPKGEPTGKFVQHAKLEGVAGAFGPPGIIIGGLGEDELEVLGDAVERVLAGADGKPVVNVPFLVLGKDEVSSPPNVNPALRRCSRIKSSTCLTRCLCLWQGGGGDAAAGPSQDHRPGLVSPKM